MPAYSGDLRKKVLEYYNKNKHKTKTEIANTFGIDRKTLYTWIIVQKNEGRTEPKTRYQKGHSHKITDLGVFKNFVDSNPNSTLEQLAKKWGGISSETVRRGLAKIKYTLKKNNLVIASVVIKNEPLILNK